MAQSTAIVIQYVSDTVGRVSLRAPCVIPQSGLIRFDWSGPETLTNDTNDWITFITDSGPPSSSNLIGGSWAYTYGGQGRQDGEVAYPPAIGSVILTAPALTGIYYAYYCINNGYVCQASVTVLVTDATVPSVNCYPTTKSTVQHVVLIISENHSFDSIYGRYCTAPAGSDPSCTDGPSCCEATPSSASGVGPTDLTDAQNLAFDPDHSQSNEVCEIHGGAMDRYVTGCGDGSSASNFAVADNSSASVYWDLASRYALADAFYQSSAGASSQNDMYFITGQYMFTDDTKSAQNATLNGNRCYTSDYISYYNPTILHLFDACHLGWKVYAEGWDKDPDGTQCYPDYYDATDIPASYYPALTLDPGAHWADYTTFYDDIARGTLPPFSIMKGLGIHSEHPGISTLTAGETISRDVVKSVLGSPLYYNNTVVLLTPDESGGYYDHKPTPPRSPVDHQPYGPRQPLVVVGYAAKTNYVSHVGTEPSSIVKFLEWNWFGGITGQLKTRDVVVNNLGDLFDEGRAGVKIPNN